MSCGLSEKLHHGIWFVNLQNTLFIEKKQQHIYSAATPSIYNHRFNGNAAETLEIEYYQSI